MCAFVDAACGGKGDVSIESVNHNGVAYTLKRLPEGVAWPTFHNDKQSIAFAQELYIRRDSIPDVNRREETLRKLRMALQNGFSFRIAWLGNPGIGKSVDYNDILLQVVQNLGQPGWWSTVAFKNQWEGVTLYTRSNPGGLVLITAHQCKNRSDLENILNQCDPATTLLVNELDESEGDRETSCIPSGMSMLLSLSTRESGEVLKSVKKSGKLHRYYVSPPTEEVCREMLRELVEAASPKQLTQLMMLNELDIPNGDFEQDRAALLAEFYERLSIVGPIMRSIISVAVFTTSFDFIHASISFKELQAALGKWTIENNPVSVRHFGAGYLREGVTIPSLEMSLRNACRPSSINSVGASGGTGAKRSAGSKMNDYKPIYTLQLHSDYIRTVVANCTKKAAEVALLSSDRYDFQILEHHFKAGLRAGAQGAEHWEWYADPGSKRLTVDLALKGDKIPKLPQWEREVKYNEVILRADPQKLENGVIYSCLRHNGRLLDFLLVSQPVNDEQGERVREGNVYLVQCTHKDFKSHALKEGTVEQILCNFGLHKKGTGDDDTARGNDYKVVILCVSDMSSPPSRGAHIELSEANAKAAGDEKATSIGEDDGKVVTVEQWGKTERAKKYAPVSCVMVRVKAFPKATSRLVGGQPLK